MSLISCTVLLVVVDELNRILDANVGTATARKCNGNLTDSLVCLLSTDPVVNLDSPTLNIVEPLVLVVSCTLKKVKFFFDFFFFFQLHQTYTSDDNGRLLNSIPRAKIHHDLYKREDTI